MSKKQFTIKSSISGARAYRNFAFGLFSFLIAFTVASFFAPVQPSDASEITITNSATGNYVTITSADNVDLAINASPTGSLAFAMDTINVKTNVSTGYKLYLSTTSADMYNTADTDHSKVHFTPVSGTQDTPSELDVNTWGFSLSEQNLTTPENSATWAAVPENEFALLSESSSQTTVDGIDTPIYYGANATTRLPSGDYTTTVIYTAIAEDTSAPLMQEFTNAMCDAMGTDTTQVLMDSRNSKTYHVVKARDGNCWMADNLSIDNITIYPEDSNINSGSFTIPASSNWNTNDYSQALVHVATNSGYEGEHYYNWYAATAGATPTTATSNVTTSICPKGWRLPENGDNTVNKSWAKLLDAYNITTGEELTTPDTTAPQYSLGFTLYYGDWDWSFALENYQGSYGFFWSSTSTPETSAYNLSYISDTVYPQYYSFKGYGFSIRCVFGDSRTLQDITYMQDINTNICQNTAETTSYADAKLLQDKRGTGNAGGTVGGYKVIKAKDGNCWMADNLNLYNATISAENSDFTSPATYTIPAGITATSQWNSNIYNAKRVEVPHGLGNNATKDSSYYTATNPKVGVFYNWTVAVAKEDTTSYTTTGPDTSICPKGFTLPVNGDSTRDKSWAKLLDTYGITTGAQLLANSALGFSLYYGYWGWSRASEHLQGSHGYFWSGTPSSETNAYYPTYNSGAVYPQANDGKGVGFSIRCVAR